MNFYQVSDQKRQREADERAMRMAHKHGGVETMVYEVINLDTDESHGDYVTLKKARARVALDKLRAYSIWRGNVRVECCEPYDGDDDRARQGLGQ